MLTDRVRLPLEQWRALERARRRGQQTCKVCGRPQEEVDFIVSATAWEKVVPRRWRGRAVCMACFDRFAIEQQIHTVKVFLVNGP
jgi:hypothetical protein